jgi:hypothetical protein
MSSLKIRSASEQVAEHLRAELLRGVWSGVMPGEDRLVTSLGVGRDTVKLALRHLEQEGLLVGQGPGRRRLIVLPSGGQAVAPMRVVILLGVADDRRADYMVDLQHTLVESGHSAFFHAKTLAELGMDLPRIRRLIADSEADAWVVFAGSREVLKWFAAQQTPLFALAGRMEGLSIAGTKPDKVPSYIDATRHLVGLGHRRIALLVKRERRLPEPGRSERAFLEELQSHGIHTGPYNLPDWEDSIDGFHQILDSLFTRTPPTALIIDESAFFFATQQFLLNRGIRVPQDISLLCTDGDPVFAWCKPAISHIKWDHRPVVRRIVRWANNVASGKDDRRQSLTKAEFVVGGTVGPARDWGSRSFP